MVPARTTIGLKLLKVGGANKRFRPTLCLGISRGAGMHDTLRGSTHVPRSVREDPSPTQQLGPSLRSQHFRQHTHAILGGWLSGPAGSSSLGSGEIWSWSCRRGNSRRLGWEFRFWIPIPGTAGIRNSISEFGIPEFSGGK
jgi:hypothetical protein